MSEKIVRNPGLHIVHKEKGGAVDRTVGRIGSLFDNTLLGTPLASFKDAPKELADYIQDRFKDVEWKGNIEIYLNDSPFFHQMKRLFSKDRRANFFLRATFGLGNTLWSSMSGKLWRASSYNPFTESGQVYHPRKEVALQKVGIAEFFNEARKEGKAALLYSLPVLRAEREFSGARNAMRRLETDEERKEARKILEPHVGKYVGLDIGRITGFLLKHTTGFAAEVPTIHAPIPFRLPLGIPIGYPLDIPFFAAVGALAGHIHARTASENIFYDKKARTPAKPAFATA